jgi:quercetin dioxygenase-like cupin family protein
MKLLTIFACVTAVTASTAMAQDHSHGTTPAADRTTKWTHRLVLDQSLNSSSADLEQLKVDEMTIPPGGEDTVTHRHTAHLVGYVVEGEVITKMKDKPAQTFKAGQAFYEYPDEIHESLRNTSKLNRAVILLYYQYKKDAVLYTPLYKKN